MLRIKIPQGILDGEQLEAWPRWPSATRAASATSPRARTSSSTSCACPTSARHAPAGRGRAHHPRGLRQLRPQRHRLPLRRGRARRGVRRHPLRRGAHPAPAAPPPELAPAAQVQDRVRGLPRGPRLAAINDIGLRARRGGRTARPGAASGSRSVAAPPSCPRRASSSSSSCPPARSWTWPRRSCASTRHAATTSTSSGTG